MNESVILPADTYLVINKTVLNDQDRNILIKLYQPIVGGTAINLYLSLWSSLDLLELFSKEKTHHSLMSNMGIRLSDIKIAREKLEAIGLIQTYFKDGSINNYIYELYSPLSASEYFSNPILATTLYNHVGEEEYKKLVEYFKMPRFNLREYENISKNMSEVFQSFPSDHLLHLETDMRGKQKIKNKLVSNIDLDSVLGLIPDGIIKVKSITREVRTLIDNLSFIYNLDEDALLNLIRSSLTDKGTIDRDKIRIQARSYYTFEHSGKLPSIVYKNQPDYLRAPLGDVSPKAKMIYQFEQTTPYDFLCGKNKGIAPTKNEKLVLEYLLIDLGMMPGVVNVLVDYVLRINNNKLTKNFVEAIATQWVRSDIKTVTEAMDLAQKEIKSRNKRVNKERTKVKVEKNKPVWFDENQEKEELSSEELEKIKKEFEQFS